MVSDSKTIWTLPAWPITVKTAEAGGGWEAFLLLDGYLQRKNM